MNYKSLLKNCCFAVVMALGVASCSQDEAEIVKEPVLIEAADLASQVVYTMHFECAPPDFEGKVTRSSTDWADNSTIYLKFGDNATGTAVYNKSSNTWSVTISASGTLPTTSSSETVTAFYFDGAGSATETAVKLKEKTAIYQGSGTYTHPTDEDIYVSASLSPYTWRLGFNGRSVELQGSESNLRYYKSFDPTTHGLKKATMGTVSLAVGEYVYGFFTNSGDADNTIQVKTDATYKRTIKGNELAVKNSGKLTAPVESNYGEKGWEKVGADPEPDITPNCKLEPNDFVAFEHGFVTDWTVGVNVSYSYTTVFKKNAYDAISSDENAVINQIVEGSTSDSYSAETTSTWSDESWFTPNSEYVLCTISYNSAGKRGELVAYPFTTMASTAPLAAISNLVAGTYNGSNTWKWNVNMSNGATAYYVNLTENESWYNYTNDYHLAWIMHYWITSGQMTTTYDYESLVAGREGSKATCLTWAVNSSGNIGNFSIAKASTTSSSRTNCPTPISRFDAHGRPLPQSVICDANLLKNGRALLIMSK